MSIKVLPRDENVDCCAEEGGNVPLIAGGQGRSEGELLGDAALLGVAIGALLGAGVVAFLWVLVS